MERRISPRSLVSLTVYLYLPGQHRHRCRAVNLSSRGLFIETDLQRIPDNRPMMLFIATRKPDDPVVRLHRMLARVVRHSQGGVGLMFWRNEQWNTGNREMATKSETHSRHRIVNSPAEKELQQED